MIPAVPWAEFKRTFRWNQSEHVAAIAPTGAGKTTLFTELMPYRSWNIVLGTKPADKLYDSMLANGFKRIETIKEIRPWHQNYLLWPQQRKTIPETVIAQRAAFQDALNTIVQQKSWTLWVDEAKYISEFLKMRMELTYCLEQLRSINATIICGAQRPAWVPPSTLSNSTHVFLWKTTDRRDAQRLADIGGVDGREVLNEAKSLGEHEFIYIRSRGTDSKMVRSEVRN